MQFTPSIYEHAAKLIGESPWNVSRDGDLMVEAHRTAFQRYEHTPIVVGIDIYNLEAEAYGAVVARPEGNGIPAVTEHPCRLLDDILALKPLDPAAAGRIPMVLDAARQLAADLPEADVRVPVSGPFSIAVNLMGFEGLLMALALDADHVAAALQHLVAGQIAFCRAVHDAGISIALFESAATPPLVAPEQFRLVELPAIRKLASRCEEVLGRSVPCIIGGNTEPILDAMLATGTGYVICPSETDQPAFMAQMASHPDVMVRVNMNPGIVAGGSDEEILSELDRVLALARGREKVCLGSGALAYETPPENVDKIRAYLVERQVKGER